MSATDHRAWGRTYSLRNILIFIAAIGIWFPTLEIHIGPIALNVCELALLAVIPTLVGPDTYRKRLDLWALTCILGFACMATLTALQLFYVTDNRAALGILLKFGLSAIFALALVTSPGKYQAAQAALKGFIAAGFLCLLISNLDYFFEMLGGQTYAHMGDRRAAGFFQHANQYAIWTITLVPLVILTVKNRFFSYASLANIVIALISAGSKFNLAVLFVILWLSFGLRWRVRFPTLLVLGIPIFAIASGPVSNMLISALRAVNPKYAAKAESAFLDPTNAASYLGRIDIWKDAISYGKENPILGIGGGQAYTVLEYSHAHNLFMQYFLTYGILGTLVLLAIFFAAFVASMKGDVGNNDEHRLKYALTLCLIGLFISNQSSDSMASHQILLFGVIVGFILAFAECRAEHSANAGRDGPRRSSETTVHTQLSPKPEFANRKQPLE